MIRSTFRSSVGLRSEVVPSLLLEPKCGTAYLAMLHICFVATGLQEPVKHTYFAAVMILSDHYLLTYSPTDLAVMFPHVQWSLR